MPRDVSGVRSLALGTVDHQQLYIGTVDNNIWCTSLNAGSESPLVGAGAKLVKIMEVSDPSQEVCSGNLYSVMADYRALYQSWQVWRSRSLSFFPPE